MTTEELIEWHTKNGHWRFLTVEEDRQNRDDPIGITHDSWVQKLSFFPSVRRSPPFPATIDGAASAMPDDWWWELDAFEWKAHKSGSIMYCAVRTPDTHDEIHDRYLLAKLAWEAMAAPK